MEKKIFEEYLNKDPPLERRSEALKTIMDRIRCLKSMLLTQDVEPKEVQENVLATSLVSEK